MEILAGKPVSWQMAWWHTGPGQGLSTWAATRRPLRFHGVGRQLRAVQRIHRGLAQQAAPHGCSVVGLGHGAHELAGDAQQHVGGQVEVRVFQVLRNPGRQLVALVVPLVPLVCKWEQGQGQGTKWEGQAAELAKLPARNLSCD